jgi:PAS domain S-box-containing protein
MLTASHLQQISQEVEQYVEWTADDALRMTALRPHVLPALPELAEDFYREIQKHPRAAQVMTGGLVQVDRLKGTLVRWMEELLAGPYGPEYAAARGRVGMRHVEIGLPQVFTSAALARLRTGMLQALYHHGLAANCSPTQLSEWVQSLNKRIDIDLAIIAAVYEAEFVRRQKELERARLEDLLHQQREFAAGVLGQLQAVVLVVDLQGRIERFNPYLAQLAQREPEAVLGQSWLDVFVQESTNSSLFRRLSDLVQPSASTGNGVTVTAPLPVADGSTRTLRWSSTVLRDPQGAPSAVLLLGHDITDIVEAERKTLQSQRLATIGQVVAGLAHEVRNALQRIQACSEMLELDLPAESNALDLVRRIQQAQTQMATLLDEVRSYAAPIQLDRSRKKLSESWRDAWDQVAALRSGRQAVLVEACEHVDLTLNFDPFRISQVFRNLFENSLAACRDPVEITVGCAPTLVSGAPALSVSVTDNGPGLTVEQKKRIFEPFFTTKTKGTGLGMAIAQRIVESHGGTIKTGGDGADRPCSGAQIVFTLPRGAA